MLTREMAIAEYDFPHGRIVPDRLTRGAHRHYVGYADRMLRVYQMGVGRTRRELHQAVGSILADEPDCPPRRVEAFAKLLDDAGLYARDKRGRAARLRREVFSAAAASHPLVAQADGLFGREEAAVKAEIAAGLGRPWTEIDRELFADVIEFHRLCEFQGYPGPEALLARYNVAQVQAALFDAVSMTVEARDDFKTIVRYAKLAGLMHSIVPLDDGGYRLRLDGPASVLRETRRYGTAMARFLPALIACRGWRMHAVCRTRRRGWSLSLELSAEDGLTSHLPAPEEFDSAVEAAFARKWGEEPRDGWTLVREGKILHQGQKVFVPDFAFRHADGRQVLLEIVGFWTPEYLRAKIDTLRAFAGQPILLAVADPGREPLGELPVPSIPYKTALAIKDVLERLERFASEK